MTRLSDHKTDEAVTALIYGASGSGKTFLAGTVGNDALIVTPSNGAATLKSPLFRQLVGTNPYLEIVHEEPMPEKATGFDLVSDIVDRYLKEKRNEIKTIVVEDSTNLRRMAMNKGLELNQQLNRSKTKQNQKEVIVPTIQDYSIEMNLIEQFVRYYTEVCKQLNINFVMTAHERIQHGKPESLGQPAPVIMIRPAFTGQTFPDDITGLFDITWHTETRGANDRVWYQLRTAGDSVIAAKTRTGGLFPTLIETFTPLTKIFACIEQKIPLSQMK